MKGLILSFFAIILGYSLIFNDKGADNQPVIKDNNSVYVTSPDSLSHSDTMILYGKHFIVALQ